MSDHRYYISVMSPPASSGSFDVTLETLDACPNLTMTALITGLTANADPTATAILIQNQLDAMVIANGASYCGRPSFSAEPYRPDFQLTRTEHCICLWSQAQFSTTIYNDTSGGNYYMSTTPIWATLARARSMAYGNIVDNNGIVLTDEQLTSALENANSELSSVLRNNIVVSTYLGEWRGEGFKSVFTRPLPGLHINRPLIRRKNLYEMYSIPQYSELAYNWIRHSGELEFRFNQTYVNAGEPFELDNEIRCTWTAGYPQFPAELQRALVSLVKYRLQDTSGVRSMGGGSWKVEFSGFKEKMYDILFSVKKYKQNKQK